ncbi:MAG TPA: TraM recognition domain-containing protein, partial [Planctomycetota bacterium]|nr:TraM recognition domain-containing protein [Planctomycetota bacterium]
LAPSDVADRICSIMPREGASESFRNFAWQFVSIVATALDRLGETVSLAKLERYCFRDTWMLVGPMIGLLCPDVRYSANPDTYIHAYRIHCLLRQTSYIEIDQLISMVKLDREYFAKVAGALKNVLTKLSTESIGFLLSPGDVPPPPLWPGEGEPPELSWWGIDRDRLVVYFYLGSLIGPDTASATARLALADLMSYVGRKYAFDEASRFLSRRLTVIVDEVADALAPESVNILNKARGAGLSLVMAGQSLADLEVALGGPAEARRALANVGSFLTFRAANPDDARYFSEKVGVRPLPSVTRGVLYEPSGMGGRPKGLAGFGFRTTTSVSRRSEPLLPTSALDRLARFHYFGLWGGELRKGLLPLLDPPAHLHSRTLKKRALEAASARGQGRLPGPEGELRPGPPSRPTGEVAG